MSYYLENLCNLQVPYQSNTFAAIVEQLKLMNQLEYLGQVIECRVTRTII